MNNFIADLCAGVFYQEIINDEEFLKKRNKQLDELISLQGNFEKELSDEQKQFLKDLQSKDGEIWAMEVEHYFARGVKIGMQLQSALDKIKL